MVESFRDQVAAHGAPVKLITFKGEGHGLSNPSSHMAAAQAQIRWFQKYLAGSTAR
jgi:dipeptidyl aminopeptidase/acylaminoacyl peptidase